MGRKKISEVYYIKKDGIVSKCTRSEYKEYLLEKKEQMVRELCPNCRVFMCDKLRYRNINICSNVNDALYSRKVYISDCENGNRKTLDIDFHVYDCCLFEEFRDEYINKQKKIKDQILEIDERIFKLRYTPKSVKSDSIEQDLIELKKEREEKLKTLDDYQMKKNLEASEKQLRKKYVKKLFY